MNERTQQRITPEAHAALKAYRLLTNISQERIASDAILEYIARRNIAHRWDGERYTAYTVSYPDGIENDSQDAEKAPSDEI